MAPLSPPPKVAGESAAPWSPSATFVHNTPPRPGADHGKGHGPGHNHGHDHEPSPGRGRSRTRATVRDITRGVDRASVEEKYDHEDDYDSDDPVYISEGEEEGRDEEEAVGESRGSGEVFCLLQERIRDVEAQGSRQHQGQEPYSLPQQQQPEQYSQEVNNTQESQDETYPIPWYWQCHLCAYINPLFPDFNPAATSNAPIIDSPQLLQYQQQYPYQHQHLNRQPHQFPNQDPYQDPYQQSYQHQLYPQPYQSPYLSPYQSAYQPHQQHSSSFASLPVSFTQPCANRDVPPREPGVALENEHFKVPEDGSWEKRVRDAAISAAAAANAYAATLAAKTNPAVVAMAPNAIPIGIATVSTGAQPEIGVMPMSIAAAGYTSANVGGRMLGTSSVRVGERVVPPSPLRNTAFSSQSLDKNDDNNDSTAALSGAVETETRTLGQSANASAAIGGVEKRKAGSNYAPVPLSYAFSTADSSRSGPSTPLRSSRRTRGLKRTWPGFGGLVAPRIGLGHGQCGWMSAGPIMPMPVGVATRDSHIWPQDPAMMTSENIACDVGGHGSVFGAGMGGRCWHSRCEGCYDLDAEKRVLGFCAGTAVDMRQYEAWYASFGFSGSGDEPMMVVVDGGAVVGLKGEEEEEEEALMDDEIGDEHDAMEIRRDDAPMSGKRSRSSRSSAHYNVGETRILLVQNAHSSSSSDDDGDGTRNHKSARASSDGGEGIFGVQGGCDDDNSGGEDSDRSDASES